ncbi:hypothetical protein BSKO_09852 [Bryopsis sp. KO-2023]|nr:hypothetical protein BSKO_09852 [Bryopsis sp. KO-2023]
MHSFWYRTNALATFAGTVLACICIAASVTDLFHVADVQAKVEISKMDFLKKNVKGNDEARLGVALDVDLGNAFTWNTKQLFVFLQAEYETPENHLNQVALWDQIILKKEDAKITKRVRQEYAFDDQGRNLRGKEFNLTLVWNVMPRVGRLYTESKTFTGFSLPEDYTK